MEIILNLGTKSFGFKNIRIRVDGALVGRENRLEIYWCVFCSIFLTDIFQHMNSNQDVNPLAGQAPRTNFHSNTVSATETRVDLNLRSGSILVSRATKCGVGETKNRA